LPSDYLVAVVFILTTSLPALGSLIDNAPTNSPEHNFGKYFYFYSELPCLTNYAKFNAVCAPYDSPILPLALLSSSITIQCAV